MYKRMIALGCIFLFSFSILYMRIFWIVSNPELCSTLSIGSGIIDNRIMIYDYAGGASYELSDRGNFDYVLNMQEDSLVVEKRVYMQNELVESGELVFLDDTLQIKTE